MFSEMIERKSVCPDMRKKLGGSANVSSAETARSGGN